MRQCMRFQLIGQEMSGVTWTKSAALGTGQVRDIWFKVDKLMGDQDAEDTSDNEGAEEERDMTKSETSRENRMGATASNDWSDSVDLCQVIRVDISGTGDGRGTMGGCSVLSRATKRNNRIRNQIHSIWNKKKNRVCMAVRKGCSLPVDEQMDLSNGATSYVVITDVWGWGEQVILIVNIYNQWDTQSAERPAWKLKWQRIIHQGGTMLGGDFNTDGRRLHQSGTDQWDA